MHDERGIRNCVANGNEHLTAVGGAQQRAGNAGNTTDFCKHLNRGHRVDIEIRSPRCKPRLEMQFHDACTRYAARDSIVIWYDAVECHRREVRAGWP